VDAIGVEENGDVVQWIPVDNQQIGQLGRLHSPDEMVEAKGVGTGGGGSHQGFRR
jgi:hypothetical protein